MPAAPRPRAGAAFALRSATLTTVALVLETTDIALLADELDAHAPASGALFENDPVVIDLGRLRDAPDPVDYDQLLPLLRRHGMVPVAVRGGSESQLASARAAGLIEAPEGHGPALAAVPPPAPRSEEPEPAAPVVTTVKLHVPPLVIDKPLRSGQQVYARGTDLIVLGLVSHGAEVIADGHIHVYAPLRGRAIAGARGNAAARIFSTCMEPQLVSIAGTYRTSETALPDNVLGKPAQVRLDGDRLVVEPLVIR